jgi:dihydropteroate synthase
MKRRKATWDLATRKLKLGQRTLVMGILNVTPDSFSDGGKYLRPAAAVAHGLRLLEEGAEILDVGGESTRPGSNVPVTAEQEAERILPVITELKRRAPECVISVDTYKAWVAEVALAAGAEIVNDVSGLEGDPAMAATVARAGCGLVLMQMRGRPAEWRILPPLKNPVAHVKRDLAKSVKVALAAGIAAKRIVLDPGIGFGKNFEENYPLLARLGELSELGYPLLAGTSRKSFIGRTVARAHGGGETDVVPPEQRVFGTLASEAIAVLQGAHIIRSHDVKACVDAVRVADEVVKAGH